MFYLSIVNETNHLYTTHPVNLRIPVNAEFDSVDDYLLSLKHFSATKRVATESFASSKLSSSKVGVNIRETHVIESRKKETV